MKNTIKKERVISDVTRKSIIETIEAMVSEGVELKSITNRSVKENLSDGGSFADISPVLRTWKTESEKRSTVAVEMPENAQKIFNDMNSDIWSLVTDIASEKLIKIQKESDEEVAAATSERDDNLNEIDRLENEIVLGKSELDQVNDSKNKIKTDLGVALTHVNDLSMSLATKQEIERERDGLLVEKGELKSSNTILTKENTTLKIIKGKFEISSSDNEELKAKVSAKEKEILGLNSKVLKISEENQMLVNNTALLQEVKGKIFKIEESLKSSIGQVGEQKGLYIAKCSELDELQKKHLEEIKLIEKESREKYQGLNEKINSLEFEVNKTKQNKSNDGAVSSDALTAQ